MEQIVKMKFIDIQVFPFSILLFSCIYLKNTVKMYNIQLVSTKIHNPLCAIELQKLLESKILCNFIWEYKILDTNFMDWFHSHKEEPYANLLAHRIICICGHSSIQSIFEITEFLNLIVSCQIQSMFNRT